MGDRKRVCLRVRLEILAAVLRNQGRLLEIILQLVERLVEFPLIKSVCLHEVGSLEVVKIGTKTTLSSRMENIWELRDEVKENRDETGVHVSVPGILACVTCFKVEEGHDHEACKISEENRIKSLCKEVDDMIDLHKGYVVELEKKLERDLLRMLCGLELNTGV